MTASNKIRLQAAAVFLIAVVAFLLTYPQGPNIIRDEVKLHLGLDLAGGAHLVYEADVSSIPEPDRESAVFGTRDVIERRVNAIGVAEPLVQTNKSGDTYRIIVELPGVTDVNDAIQRIGDTPVLEFKKEAQPIPIDEEEKQRRIVYNEEQKRKAQSTLDELIGKDDKAFSEMAQTVSEDMGTKERGGNLDFTPQGTFIPEFEEIVFDKIKDGEMYNKLLETPYGFHIIRRIESRCYDKIKSKEIPCSEVQQFNDTITYEVRARHILFIIASLEEEAPLDPWANTELSGKHLKRASVVFDNQSGLPVVNLEFNKEGGDLFEQITERNVNKLVGIFLDGGLISAPRVQQKISGGTAVITGDFTIAEAQELAKRLNAGALPVKITLASQTQIGASLGQEAVEHSFLAGVLGMVFVMIFMIIYYRLPGALASLSLVIYTCIIIALFKLIPVVLTLSGIAGFILSIGMTVDANVLIFERIKEELRNGKTLQSAIDEGFSRAWVSIRDSNLSTLITAFILLWLGESLIKGFGITLAIGIIISMFTAITITRVLLKIAAKYTSKHPRVWT